MATTPALQTQIEAIQARIDALAPDASSEDIVMLAKAVEAVGGQTTVFDVLATAAEQQDQLLATTTAKTAELVAEGDTQVSRVVAQGEAKHAELNAELQTYAAFTGASDDADGALGMVPAPVAGEEGQYLRGDGDWRSPGEVPIGGIALLYPEMAGSRYLPAQGGTVLIEDYPELYEVLGQAPTTMPTPSVGSTVLSNESPGYSYNRAAAVNGEHAVIVRSSSSGIQWSANGGASWANAQIGSIGYNGPYRPALSDSGRTVGWLSYDNTSPYPRRFQATTAAFFGSWSSFLNLGSEQLANSWDVIVIGLPDGVAALGKSMTDSDQVLFQYLGDGDTTITREVNFSTEIDPRITQVAGVFRFGARLYLLADGSNWRALLHTDDAGATWETDWEGTGTWGNHRQLLTTSQSMTIEDAQQPSYVENGLGIVQSGTQLLLIGADGTLTWVDQPAGHTLIAGSLRFYAGHYYAASANAVFRTTDFSAWEPLATATEILGISGTISRMWLHAPSGSFGFHSTADTLLFVQTRDFQRFKRSPRPLKWGTSIILESMRFSGDRFVWLMVRQHSSSTYYDFGLFDLQTGRLYARDYWSNYSSSTPSGRWLLPLPEGRCLHYSQQGSTSYVRVVYPSSLHNYDTDTQFRLPTSTYSFPAVAAYGNTNTSMWNTSAHQYGGYRYFVRAQ